MTAITKYLAGVLTVIALGTTAIAYSLAFPNAASVAAREPGMINSAAGPAGPYAYPASQTAFAAPGYYPASAVPMNVPQSQFVQTAPAVRTVEVAPAPRRVVTRTVERAPRRDWKKTAMVIGGSTAAGAGIGGIFAGKKGALIGAAVGGGASTIYQTLR